MAQMDTDGIEEAIRQLNKADLFTDENVKRMLTAGSEVMLASVKSAFVDPREGQTWAAVRHKGFRAQLRPANRRQDPGRLLLVDRGTQHLAAGQRQDVRRRCRHSERRMTCLNLIFAA